MRTPYVVGPPVRLPTDFFGRARQTGQFFETLAGAQLQCVSVLGLRRAGKTSFLQYVSQPEVMAAYLPDPRRYVMLYVDVSICKTAAEFYGRVYRQLLAALLRVPEGVDRAPQAADVYAVESLLYEFRGRRVVFLLDEFDQLRTADFSADFMTELRALAGVWDFELAYVTASYWNLARLGNYVGLPPTSPFYNIFYPTPIYLSGLSPAELDQLVRVPAGRVGIIADDADVAYVRHNAGTLPFFVQALAAVWLAHKAQGRMPNTRDVTQRAVSEMWPYFEQWWRNFSDVERDALMAVAQEKPLQRLPYDEEEVDRAVQYLTNYGVIAATGEHLWTDSALFAHWLNEYARKNGRSPRGEARAGLNGGSQARPKPAGQADAGLTERLLQLLESAAGRIERRPSSDLPDGFSGLFENALRSDPAIARAGLTVSAAGQSGVIARAGGASVFVADSAPWQGQKALLQSVDQLLRCLTAPGGHAAQVVLVGERESGFVADAVTKAMPRHAGYAGFEGRRGPSRYDYRCRLTGDNREVGLSILLVRLPD